MKNRFYLTTLFWMTPCKSAANILRWKADVLPGQGLRAARRSSGCKLAFWW